MRFLLLALALIVGPIASAQIDLPDGRPIRGGEGFSGSPPSYLVVVKVESRHYGGWYGSGAFIDQDLVLTCDHNVRDIPPGGRLAVQTVAGNVYWNTEVVLRQPVGDMALIRVKGPIEYHRVIGVTNSRARPGIVYSEGFDPRENGFGRYRGETTDTTYGESDGTLDVYMEHEARAVPGMSGGPVVDGLGKVVGVTSASDGKTALCCLPYRLHEFLDRLNDDD